MEKQLEKQGKIKAAQEYMNKYNGWVPCASGIMPEHVMEYNYKTEHPIINVLVSLKSGHVTKVQRTIYDYDHRWYFTRMRSSDVLAWMPLPEKYKGDL